MNIFKRIAEKIKSLLAKKNALALKIVPVAIDVVEIFKKVTDGPYDEILVTIIKTVTSAPIGFTAEQIRQAFVNAIPKSLLTLNMVKIIAEIDDPVLQVKAILEQFKFSDETEKKQAYHLLCTHMIEYLADGKLTWGECVKLAEEGYELYVLQKNGAIAA